MVTLVPPFTKVNILGFKTYAVVISSLTRPPPLASSTPASHRPSAGVFGGRESVGGTRRAERGPCGLTRQVEGVLVGNEQRGCVRRNPRPVRAQPLQVRTRIPRSRENEAWAVPSLIEFALLATLMLQSRRARPGQERGECGVAVL